MTSAAVDNFPIKEVFDAENNFKNLHQDM